jgi:alpha-beta hydrolase superfamily lysophospholipase
MGGMMSAPRKAGFWSRRFGKVLMSCLFRPLFGWRSDKVRDARDLQHFEHVGGDGSCLAGALCESGQAQVKAVVILCHPFLKFGMSYFFKNNYHEWLSQAGYHVVGFNFKGFGRSTVEGMSFSEDVISMAQWSRQRYPDLPVHLLGISFGAFHGIHAIASGRAVFDSALFDSVPATLTHFFGKGLVGAVMRSMSKSRWADVTGTKAIFRSLPLPAALPRLFLFGDQDAYITQDELGKVRRSCGADNVRMYRDCGHLGIRKAFPAEYIAAVTQFFDANSAPRPAQLAAGQGLKYFHQ